MREGIKTYLADLLVMGGGGTFLKPVLGVIAPTHFGQVQPRGLKGQGDKTIHFLYAFYVVNLLELMLFSEIACDMKYWMGG